MGCTTSYELQPLQNTPMEGDKEDSRLSKPYEQPDREDREQLEITVGEVNLESNPRPEVSGGIGTRKHDIDPTSDPLPEIYAVWKRALITIDNDSSKEPLDDNAYPPKAPRMKTRQELVVNRTGWKTLRIFISSTFKDLHAEREVLVKQVFPQLRMWCQSRRLHVVDCDLRWGVPKYTSDGDTMRICLSEIDHCAAELSMPFFLGMISERAGKLDSIDTVPEDVQTTYNWVDGLTITEMEIMHAAFRKGNPNALFMLRDPTFIEGMPLDQAKEKGIIEDDVKLSYKVSFLRTMLEERFLNVKEYKCKFTRYNEGTNRIELSGLETDFAEPVLNFFKSRIETLFPCPAAILDPFLHAKEHHESFMKSNTANVIGRDDLLNEIAEYISGPGTDTPLLIVGGPGAGKTCVMTRVTYMVIEKALKDELPRAKGMDWRVFYHYVGAVPGSTDLNAMLQRFLVEMEIADKESLPENLDQAALMCTETLSENPSDQPIIVIVDAVNQFDEDTAALMMSWVPRKLAPNVRCILSMIPDTEQHIVMTSREPVPRIRTVNPLRPEDRKSLIEDKLLRYGKRLEEDKLAKLLDKKGSENPLWLAIACEELRLYGLFRQLDDFINELADDLIELEIQMLGRFEKESGGRLMVSTLCLLEASVRGLHENELKCMLADTEGLVPPSYRGIRGESDIMAYENDLGVLPAMAWACIYRVLGPFLRPFGDSGEGRLDFYHRSLSKAVRRKYFRLEDGEPDREMYAWWHTKLANYFEHSTIHERKLEEYPEHLVAIGDWKRLITFLTDWSVVHSWVRDDHSYKLLYYWDKICKATGKTYDLLEDCYVREVKKSNKNRQLSNEELELRLEKITRLFVQTGRFVKARHILGKAKKCEKKYLGSRPERMIELYQLTASIEDEIKKLEVHLDKSQLGQAFQIMVESLEKAIKLAKTLQGEKYRYKQAVMLERLAFQYFGYVLRGGDNYLSTEAAREKAEITIDESIKIFQELNMKVKVYDALITKGLVKGTDNPEQLKCYKEAEAELKRCVGESNVTVARLYVNTGIYYYDNDAYENAFTYYYRWYQLCLRLYGEKHPKIKRCLEILKAEYYTDILQREGIVLPEWTQDKN